MLARHVVDAEPGYRAGGEKNASLETSAITVVHRKVSFGNSSDSVSELRGTLSGI